MLTCLRYYMIIDYKMPSWTVQIFCRVPCSPNSKLPCILKWFFLYFIKVGKEKVYILVKWLILLLSFCPFFFNGTILVNICNFANCRYVDHVLATEKDNMRCCTIEYKYPVHSSQTYVYGGILIAGFFVYFVVIFFSSPVRWVKILNPTRSNNQALSH